MLLVHGVPSLMVLKDVRLTEPLVTEGASIRGFVRLPHVCTESGPTRKPLLAVLALKHFCLTTFVAVACKLVCTKDTRLAKSLSTNTAGVRSLALVFPPVNLQLALVRESLTTVDAFVRL